MSTEFDNMSAIGYSDNSSLGRVVKMKAGFKWVQETIKKLETVNPDNSFGGVLLQKESQKWCGGQTALPHGVESFCFFSDRRLSFLYADAMIDLLKRKL